jgi:predicted lipase
MKEKQIYKALQQMVMSYGGKYGKNKSLDGYKKVEKDNIVFYYLIDNKEKEIIVVIRGSDDFEDWKYNMKYSKIKTKYGKVHKGFWELSFVIYECFAKKIEDIFGYKIIIIGHSLGATLGQLFALDIFGWAKSIEIITAGSPRVFNRKASKYFNKHIKNHYRIVNGGDLITHLPPCFFGYKHTKNKIQIGYKGFFGGIIGWLVKSIQEHYPNNYLKNYEILRDKNELY